MTKTTQWYVVYTKPRSEKKLREVLLAKSIECYLPLLRIRKKWSDRFKWVEKPAFDSYLFLRIDYDRESQVVLKIPQVVSFVHAGGEPATLSNNDIELMRIAVDEFSDCLVIRDTADLQPGEKILIKFGPFAGKEAVIEKIQGKTLLIVSFPSLNKSLQVELPVENIGGPTEAALV